MSPAPPARIGRYEIAGRLARGGMADVLLGRLRGPGDFERPVVIKRILPHLLDEPEIVEMFVEEARTIANLRHPNLIHVHELGREGNELYIVMEYLEGESVAGLCRRLAVRGENLECVLAAHVIAQACAGLHAAHEAVDAERRPLQIIHRDVSPQNLFVSYSGAVHVIDFGIARTAKGSRNTASGTVRGKVEYLAPEQLRGIPPDRRVDIFALGIVLFELASGRRLFRRGTPAEAMAAILNHPTPSLAAIRPDAPPELDAICARALAKDPSARFQTAGEMRRALLAFVRKQGGEHDLDEELGRRMTDLFSERFAEKAAMLARVRQSAELDVIVPAPEVDVTVELLSATVTTVTPVGVAVSPRGASTASAWPVAAPTLTSGVDPASQPRSAPGSRAPRRSTLVLVLAPMVLVAAALPLALWARGRAERASVSAATAAAAPSPIPIVAESAPRPAPAPTEPPSPSSTAPLAVASGPPAATPSGGRPRPARPAAPRPAHPAPTPTPAPTIW